MDLGLQGRKAIVTGGSRGIGRAIAAALLGEGASVAICARNAEALEAERKALAGSASGTVFAYATDIGEADGIRGFVRESVKALGGLDIFVHNASGMAVPGEEGWGANLAVDILAAVRGVEEAMPALEASDAGSIVLIASISGMEAFGFVGDQNVREGIGGPYSYGPMKAALISYGNELAQALAPKGSASTRCHRGRLSSRMASGARCGATPARPMTAWWIPYRAGAWAGWRRWAGSLRSSPARRPAGSRRRTSWWTGASSRRTTRRERAAAAGRPAPAARGPGRAPVAAGSRGRPP